MECLTLTDSILKQSGRAVVFIHTFDVVGYCSVGPKGPTWEMTDADTLLLVFLRSAQWQPKDIIVRILGRELLLGGIPGKKRL